MKGNEDERNNNKKSFLVKNLKMMRKEGSTKITLKHMHYYAISHSNIKKIILSHIRILRKLDVCGMVAGDLFPHRYSLSLSLSLSLCLSLSQCRQPSVFSLGCPLLNYPQTKRTALKEKME